MAGSAQKPVKAKAKGKTSKESKVSSSSKTPKKKKANVTALQLEEMQPGPKEYSNADLRKLKAQAIARRKANLHNGYGQLLVVDENESQSWIAGYLGFHDINVLRSFMALEGKSNLKLGPCGRPSIRAPLPYPRITNTLPQR